MNPDLIMQSIHDSSLDKEFQCSLNSNQSSSQFADSAWIPSFVCQGGAQAKSLISAVLFIIRLCIEIE
eukprot:COSAG02_NODE_5092_length_4640_cov_3.630478_7_plen_68_part_00